MYKRTLIIISCIIFSVSVSGAEPNISNVSGQASEGQVITITGSEFGNNGPDLLLFDNFEGGNSGDPIKIGPGSAEIGEWEEIGGYDPVGPLYSSATSVSGSKAFRADQVNSWGGGMQYAMVRLPRYCKNIYLSWWILIPEGDNYPGEGTGESINWKNLWILGPSDGVNDNNLTIPTRLSGSWVFAGNSPQQYNRWVQIGERKGEWKRLSLWIRGAATNTGQVHMWTLDDTGVVELLADNNVATLFSFDDYNYWERIHVNGYGRETPNCHPMFDDIYVATGINARARVEIGNNRNYNECTKLSICTVNNWSNSTINATVRLGNFRSGETTYLFVFDADNNVNLQGKSITIGEDGGIDPPVDNPTGLSIVPR